MRVLVTGATGLVGNNCVRQLLVQGCEVVVLARQGADPRPLAGLDVDIQLVDLGMGDFRPEQIPRTDVMIHAAGDTHIGRKTPPEQVRLNVDATRQLAQTALQRGNRFIFVSSVDALPAAAAPHDRIHEETFGPAKHSCGYVTTKRAAEAAVMELVTQGLDAVVTNPGFMIGPWDWKPSSGRMLLRVATNFTPFGPKGGFSVCDVRDVAAALVRLATTHVAHRRYILAGTNMSYVEAWRIFSQVAGKQGPICAAGPLMRIAAGRFGDLLTRITGHEGDVNSAAIGMSNLYHFYDSERAIRELGYQVRSVEESARDAWQWFQEYGYT